MGRHLCLNYTKHVNTVGDIYIYIPVKLAALERIPEFYSTVLYIPVHGQTRANRNYTIATDNQVRSLPSGAILLGSLTSCSNRE